MRVYGEYLPPGAQQEQAVPLTMTHGESKDKRPDLRQCGCSTLCVERAVPLWGAPEDGNASENTGNTPRLSPIATFLAHHGVAPGAYSSVAEAALVPEDNRAALGDTLFITRFPATDNACGRLLAAAVAQDTGEEIGRLAHTKPTPHRPATSSKASEGAGTLYGTPYRAVVIPSSAQDTRRQQRRKRALQASYSPAQTAPRLAEPQAACCHGEAAAAAAQLRALHAAYHRVAGAVTERPLSGRGRPRAHKPRPSKARR